MEVERVANCRSVDTLAEWLRRQPAKLVGSALESSNLSGVAILECGGDRGAHSQAYLTVAQLVERRTVSVHADILRSVVRVCPVRLSGWLAEWSKALV